MRIPVRKLLPAAIGIVLGCLPVVAFSYWYDSYLERLGRDETQTNADRAIAALEIRLERVAAKLDSLATSGAAACSPAHLEAMRMATFVTAPLKELSVISAEGKPVCTSSELPPGPRPQIGGSGRTRYPDVVIEVVNVMAANLHMVRVRRILPDGSSLAGLVSIDFSVPVAVKARDGDNAYVRITGPDGALISEVNGAVLSDVPPRDLFSTTAESAAFGVRATVSRIRQQIRARHDGLHFYGMILSLAVGALLFAGTALCRQRRHAADPCAEYAAALERGEFVPYYQPIIDIVSGRLIGAEVLTRWRKPDGSLVGPGAFVHILEQSGLSGALSRHLMRQALADLGNAYGGRPHLRISFNLTAEQFEDPETVNEIRSIFGRSPMRLSQIVLELTERHEPKSFEKAREVIVALQTLGCRVALDDVGTGHSGQSSILRLGVDIIKIDKMFVDSMDNDRNSAAIIGTLVDLARKLGMDTVAEGVERFDQVTELRRRGIRAAQGFVFAPALPASSFLELVEATGPEVAAPEHAPAAQVSDGAQAEVA